MSILRLWKALTSYFHLSAFGFTIRLKVGKIPSQKDCLYNTYHMDLKDGWRRILKAGQLLLFIVSGRKKVSNSSKDSLDLLSQIFFRWDGRQSSLLLETSWRCRTLDAPFSRTSTSQSQVSHLIAGLRICCTIDFIFPKIWTPCTCWFYTGHTIFSILLVH